MRDRGSRSARVVKLGAGQDVGLVPWWDSEAVSMFEFRVAAVFQVSGRDGLIVAGTVLNGVVRPGDALRDAGTGRRFEVLGIDLACPRPRREHHDIGLLVPRAAQDVAVPGRIWVADSGNDVGTAL